MENEDLEDGESEAPDPEAQPPAPGERDPSSGPSAASAPSDAEAPSEEPSPSKPRAGAKDDARPRPGPKATIRGSKKSRRKSKARVEGSSTDEADASSAPSEGSASPSASPSAGPRDEVPPPTSPDGDVHEARGARHLIRGASTMAVGLHGTFLLMANEDQIERGPLYGMITLAIGLVGLLDLLGLWTPASTRGRISLRDTALFPLRGEPIWLSPMVTVPASLAVLTVGALIGGYDGLPLAIGAALLLLIPSALRRPAMMVVVVVSLLYLPFLGVYGLWDPWETHYGEVAREMLARDDWISLWWAQENFFWSKPILIFWSEALSMGAFGVDFQPDANPAHPEWAIRLPHFLMTMGALLSVYTLVSKVWTKRAGLVTAIVLATTPHFFLLAHQAITDMPFVTNMTMAICMLGLAVREKPDRLVRRYGLGPLTLSARHLVIAGISAVVLPQVLYLISRNVTFMATFPPFGWHGDLFLSGSAGNHGVPGNSPVHNVEPFLSGAVAQPVVQGLLWLCGYVGVLLLLRKERRAQALYMFAFYLFCGLAFMAKGIPGFALPGLVALFFLIGTKRWDLLLGGHLRVAAGILTVAVVGMPWYVAMYVRHGPPFTDRLLIHDHINRLTAGVHGDNGSIEYFIEQLGYGLFPWIALAPLALAAWLAPWGDLRASARRAIESRVRTPNASASSDASSDDGGSDTKSRRPATDEATARLLRWVGAGFGLAGLALGVIGHGAGAAFLGYAVALLGGLVLLTSWLLVRGTPEGAPADIASDEPAGAREDDDHREADRARGRRETLMMIALWLASAFTLFSAMTTKFHHYIFPCVPPAAILVGLAVDRLLLPSSQRLDVRSIAKSVLAGIAPLPAILGVAGLFGDVRGVVPAGLSEADATDWVMHHPWPLFGCVALIAASLLLSGLAFWLAKDRGAPAEGERASSRSTWAKGAMTTGLLAAPPVLAMVGRDMSWITDARPQGYERLIQLFVYNYGRRWPVELDYRPILTAFAVVATCVILLAAVKPLRDLAMRAFLGVALLFTVWTLDVYIMDLSPHWGQRELVQRYYEARASAEEPLVAWQMNWKGENFYSGNRVNVFVQLDNVALRSWLTENDGRTAFFLLEPSRLGSLRGVMRNSTIEEITDDRFCNKFILIRARIGQAPGAPTRETLD